MPNGTVLICSLQSDQNEDDSVDDQTAALLELTRAVLNKQWNFISAYGKLPFKLCF